MNKDILTVKDLNKYLPAIKTEVDIHFKDKLSEGLFKSDALVGLKKLPSESVDLIVTEPSLDPNNTLTYTEYVQWIDRWMEECKRVLTASGSIYIICPWESSSLYHSVLGKKFIVQSRITAERQIENIKQEIKDKGGRPREGGTYKKDKHPYGRDPLGDDDRTKTNKRQTRESKVRVSNQKAKEIVNGVSSKRKYLTENDMLNEENLLADREI